MSLKKIFCCTLYLILLSNPAYAYLDPGTGSMILNLIVGAAAGAITFASIFWQKIKNFFKRIFNKETKKNK